MPGITDVVGGQIASMFCPAGDPLPNHRAGKLRLLATSGKQRLPFAQAEFVAVGLETLLPVSLQLVQTGALVLLDLLARLTYRPADLLGIEAGRLRKGAPADLVLFDLEAPARIREEDLHSLSKNTPFEGRLVQGKVTRTLVDGRTVFRAE